MSKSASPKHRVLGSVLALVLMSFLRGGKRNKRAKYRKGLEPPAP